LDKVKQSPVTEYLETLFGELERLWPTGGSPTSHAIAWDDDGKSLILLFNVGDCVFPCALNPGDISDDPVATAEKLVAQGRVDLKKPDAEYRLITFKN
jgi:hypothetical protein